MLNLAAFVGAILLAMVWQGGVKASRGKVPQAAVAKLQLQ